MNNIQACVREVVGTELILHISVLRYGASCVCWSAVGCGCKEVVESLNSVMVDTIRSENFNLHFHKVKCIDTKNTV